MEITQKLNPLIVGGTLALTVVITYSVYIGAWVIWQEGALDFLNALFHGLDFRRIQITESAPVLQMLLFPLLIMAVWGFVVGFLYTMIYNFVESSKK